MFSGHNDKVHKKDKFLVAKLLYRRSWPSICMYDSLYVRFRGKRDFLGPYIR